MGGRSRAKWRGQGMHKRHLELLTLLLEATRSGRAVWRRESADVLRTKLAGLVCSLEFKHPVLVGEELSDPDIVKVTIGTASARFYSGSPGFDLVSQIVAASDPEVRDADNRILEHLDGLIRRISREKDT